MSLLPLVRPMALLCVTLALPSCILVAKETQGPATTECATPAQPTDAAAGTAVAKPEERKPESKPAAENAEAKARAKERKAQKRAHELELARMELDMARMEAEHEEREAARKVEEARRELDEARRDMEHFRAKLPRELADMQLDLDRSIQGKTEAEQELREMEATYAKDQFATDTKELVLMRHRKRLEFATRALELEQAAFNDKKSVELPKREREHEKKLRDAESDLRSAEFAAAKQKLSTQLELARKRWELSELERPEEDGEAKGD